ncbi:hypothetical protein BC938DRAFT_474248 [Jimgerdemannia flammicorona]|uniref:Uncharacterized protein n=1 Tax=Jimgerdemannia flammicorona TaxID=994334 RepID=A0A433QSQ2_9FUNG|nr:hypothetical protein BC938DRAFT_474248 [Jimgerdemannia flammicorona]
MGGISIMKSWAFGSLTEGDIIIRFVVIIIQDPQDPNNDVARNSFGIMQVRGMLSGAYGLLTAKMIERNKELEATQRQQRQRSHTHFDDDGGVRASHTRFDDDGGVRAYADEDHPSRTLLGFIIKVSNDILQNREHVSHQFKAGVMQRMYGVLPHEEKEEEEEVEEGEVDIVIGGAKPKRQLEDIAVLDAHVEYVMEEEGGGIEGFGWQELEEDKEAELDLPQLRDAEQVPAPLSPVSSVSTVLSKAERKAVRARKVLKREFWRRKAGPEDDKYED